ncbi:MAG: energy transducer TonB [Campylobacterales bacterium]|nr:energy transducer TonB [Campylobacterales bacterium]
MRMMQAVLISLLIHLLIVLLFFTNKQELVYPTKKSDKQEILLVNFQTVTPAPKPPQKAKIQPETPKKETIKKQEPTKEKPKIVKKIPVKINYKSTSPLANALMKESKSYQKPIPSVDQKIRRLYGTSFDKFTPTQKKFIEDNLDEIHYITQRTLTQNGYPEAALQTMQQGVNIVSFDLHPNGDITNLRLIRRMGYAILDRNTLEVIKIAYKNYPKPKTMTKIIFNVEYRINPY